MVSASLAKIVPGKALLEGCPNSTVANPFSRVVDTCPSCIIILM
jgi:hypothetical protein